jgi:PBP1b-binding outer membrane lipoprotein LpoB
MIKKRILLPCLLAALFLASCTDKTKQAADDYSGRKGQNGVGI